MSCRVVSCRVVSCRVVSCRVVSCRVGVSVEQDGDEKDKERFCEPVRRQAGTHPPRQTGPFEHEGQGMPAAVPALAFYGIAIFSEVPFWPLRTTATMWASILPAGHQAAVHCVFSDWRYEHV